MGAPKCNQFWKLRTKHGRDAIFTDPNTMYDAACEYFQWCDENPWLDTKISNRVVKGEDIEETENKPTQRPYTLSGLCLFLGVNKQYFTDFKKRLKKKDKDFSLVITRIEEIIYTNKFEGAAVGAYNSNIIARDLGLVDKKDYSSQDGTMTPRIVAANQTEQKKIAALIKKFNR